MCVLVCGWGHTLVSWQHLGACSGVVAALMGVCWCHGNTEGRMLVLWQHLGTYTGVVATHAGVMATLRGVCWCHGNT